MTGLFWKWCLLWSQWVQCSMTSFTSLKYKVSILETRDDFKFLRNQFFLSRFPSNYILSVGTRSYIPEQTLLVLSKVLNSKIGKKFLINHFRWSFNDFEREFVSAQKFPIEMKLMKSCFKARSTRSAGWMRKSVSADQMDCIMSKLPRRWVDLAFHILNVDSFEGQWDKHRHRMHFS